MAYESLVTIYRKNNSDLELLTAAYQHRFNAPFVKKLDIFIHQQGRKNSWQCFYSHTEEIIQLLTDIYKNTMKLKAGKASLSEIGLKSFAFSNMVEEIIATNKIEGVQSSKKDISIAVDKQKNKNSKEIRFWYVVNKYKKIQKQEEIDFNTSNDIRQFYDEFILEEIIAEKPENRPDGKLFRKASVVLQSGAIGKEIHAGLFPEDEIIAAMDKALLVLHDTEINCLIRIAIFHYLFGYIHPFYDGNGRVDRFISSYYLSKELDEFIGLKLSYVIKNNLKKYYDMFALTNDDFNRGDLTYFILGFLEIVNETVCMQKNEVEKNIIKLKKGEEYIKSFCPKDDTLRGIYFILFQATVFYSNGISISEMMTTLKKSRNTINKHMKEIPELDLDIDLESTQKRFKLKESVVKKWLGDE